MKAIWLIISMKSSPNCAMFLFPTGFSFLVLFAVQVKWLGLKGSPRKALLTGLNVFKSNSNTNTTITTRTKNNHTHSIKCALKKHLVERWGRGDWFYKELQGGRSNSWIANILGHCLSFALLPLLLWHSAWAIKSNGNRRHGTLSTEQRAENNEARALRV